MSRSRLLRRFAAVAIGVLALLGPHLVLSGGAAPDECAARRHGCGRPSFTVCCCPDSPVPGTTTARVAGEAVAQAPQPVPERPPVVTRLAGSLEAHVMAAPPVRYPPGDLPILLSTILI